MVPTPLCLLIDSREQTPWEPVISREGYRLRIPAATRALVAGDYSLSGYEHEIAIERKSLADWIGTLFGESERADGSREPNWDRFRREIQRVVCGVARDEAPPTPPLERFFVVVEGSREDVLSHAYRSQVAPASVLGRSDSLLVDHGIPVIWAGNRMEAARLSLWSLVRWWEGRQRLAGVEEGAIRGAIRALREPNVIPPPVPAGMRPIAEQMGVGTDRGRRKAAARRVHDR